MALKLVFILSLEKDITQIQILGDSLLVIQWMKGDYMLRNFLLQPLFKTLRIYNQPSLISHLLMSVQGQNIEANRLSKQVNFPIYYAHR
jgi:ribonuclease HI